MKNGSSMHETFKLIEDDITVKNELEDNMLTEADTVFDDAPENIEIFDNFKSEIMDYTLQRTNANTKDSDSEWKITIPTIVRSFTDVKESREDL